MSVCLETHLPMITLWQPWASLIFAPAVGSRAVKEHETRGFAYPAKLFGQRIGIHAAARPIPLHLVSEELQEICRQVFGSDWRRTLARGALLGTVTLGECRQTAAWAMRVTANDLAAGDWTPGRRAWELLDRQALSEPRPMRGGQGWRYVDRSVAA